MTTFLAAPVLVAALSLHAAAGQAAAQDLVEDAKALYAAASYEEALSALARAAEGQGAGSVDLEQYRAFCLLALGRTAEAAAAFARLVATDPTYEPSSGVASPRVRSFFAEIRAEHLPVVVRNRIASGREAFEAREFAPAAEDFALVLNLLEDAALDGWPEKDDVGVLADGFAVLARSSAAAEESADTPDLNARALTAGAARGMPGAVRDDGAAVPSAPNEPHTNGAQQGGGPPERDINPPVPVLQTMPPWVPPDAIAGSRDYKGTLKVRIGVDGRVTSAVLEEPTHPAYDVRLIHAARQWVFQPATRDGTPVESETIVSVHLHPRDPAARRSN